MSKTDFQASNQCIEFFDKSRQGLLVQRPSSHTRMKSANPYVDRHEPRDKERAFGLPSAQLVHGKADWCARSIKRRDTPNLVKADERESSRILIGKYYDILDSTVSSEYAGKRKKGSTVSELFSSLAEESRYANRKQHFREGSPQRGDQNLKNAHQEMSVETGAKDDAGREHLFYVPPKRKQDGNRKPQPKKNSVGRANSIVLKKKTPETITKEHNEKQEKEYLADAFRENKRREREPEVSLLKIKPTHREGATEPIEIVFCPVNQKQPRLKFVLEQNEHPHKVSEPTSEPKSDKKVVPKAEEAIRVQKAVSGDDRRAQLAGSDTKKKQPTNDAHKKSTTLKPSDSIGELDSVHGGEKHVSRLQAARSKKAQTSKPEVIVKETAPKKQSLKSSLKAVRPEKPMPIKEEVKASTRIERPTEEDEDKSPEKSAGVFRIILPRAPVIQYKQVNSPLLAREKIC